MLVNEVVGEAAWRHHPKPKQLPIPKPIKPKMPAERDKRRKPRSFNEPKPDDLS